MLIWVFAGRTLILLVLSCRGTYVFSKDNLVERKREKALIKHLYIQMSYLKWATSTDYDTYHIDDKRMLRRARRLARAFAIRTHEVWK